MGHRGDSIEDQLNLFKIVYKLKVSELRKKCKRLKKSENFWLSKHDEMKEKMKGLADQIEKPKTLINKLLIFKSEDNLRNNCIKNNINNLKNKNKSINNYEMCNINFNEICAKIIAEYDTEQIQTEIADFKEELEMLYFEQEEPSQKMQVLQTNFIIIESKKCENNSRLDDVINLVENLIKPKVELQKKLQHYKKVKFLN